MAQENVIGKFVPCDMLGRNRIPAAMFHGHPRFVADRLEPNFYLRELAGKRDDIHSATHIQRQMGYFALSGPR